MDKHIKKQFSDWNNSSTVLCPLKDGKQHLAEPYIFTSLLVGDSFQTTEQEGRTPAKIISIA